MRGETPAIPNLPPNQLGTYLGWLTALILSTGLLVFLFRLLLERFLPGATDGHGVDKTLVRSWLSIALVGGLLIFSAGSFFLDDTTLRSLLMGGVVASAGTATAFYFASKNAEQTQQNLLSAAFGTLSPVTVPDLKGWKVSQARVVVTALGLQFVTNPAGAGDDVLVDHTEPAKDARVRTGDTLTAFTVA